ncbi:hypothetical protein QQF64_025500 [Cirrhinus molitorella]|uniref:Uncharacterized protein n=1 Tax=Cirrhinus molitorella TaxID=172907 RepID=A0ABR3NPN4_9TELE
MLLIIETLLLILAALGQDHRAAVEGQIFPLDMAPNSVDDQYDGCTRKMADLVETEFLSDDTFELHSVQVELEAVEKQIRQLLERQAELRAALESSRDALFPDVLHSGAGTPRTLGAAAAEDASQATDDDLSPSAAPGLRDLHPEPLRSPPRDGTRRCDRRRFHRQIPAILKDESVGAIVLHAGVNGIRLRQTEVLKRDFGSLIETVRSTAPETRIIVSGPLPTDCLHQSLITAPETQRKQANIPSS